MVYKSTGNRKIDAVYKLIEEEAAVTAAFHHKQAKMLEDMVDAPMKARPTGGSDIENRGFTVV